VQKIQLFIIMLGFILTNSIESVIFLKYRHAALKFCFKTCVALKFLDDDDDDDDDT